MLKKTKKRNKNKQVTVGDLDKALSSQSKTILREVDVKLESQTKAFDVKIDKAMESQSETILEALDFRFDKFSGEIKKDLGKKDNKINKILNQQDKILKKLTDLNDESVASFDLYKKHDKKIANHEERILALEIKS